jgi:hypothetical protein
MMLDARDRADALCAEFESVSIPAEHVEPSAFIRERIVIVQTGTVPPTVHVSVDAGYRWNIAGRNQHGHDLPRRTPVEDVAELVALCVAGQCDRVSVLTVSKTAPAAERAHA